MLSIAYANVRATVKAEGAGFSALESGCSCHLGSDPFRNAATCGTHASQRTAVPGRTTPRQRKGGYDEV
jgi:hypothetical protein